MPSTPQKPPTKISSDPITEEYRILHKVAQILQSSGDLKEMLRDAMRAITGFHELKVENKAGIFLVDEEKKVLRLFTTFGDFSEEFLEKEKEVPFGNCLCGRVAVSGELLMSESCFSDSRHERTFSDMKAHGHYIVPLTTSSKLVGVLFLYTNTSPVWYKHSQEVLLSIGGLIADALRKKQIDQELEAHRVRLESLVDERTEELTQANQNLTDEVESHKRTHEELRRLSHQIQEIREEEKCRISREVHDELGQSLTALKMDLLRLEKIFPDATEEFENQTESMVNLVDATIQSVQRIAMELRPPILDAFGLCEAIAWQAGEYDKRFGIHFDLNCLQNHVDLVDDLKTTLFRIFQEAVTNVVRHAEAQRVQVSMNCTSGQLVLEIQDDGKGIRADKINHSHSLGLIGIRERVRYWNGQVHIQGAPLKGTHLTITIPLPSP